MADDILPIAENYPPASPKEATPVKVTTPVTPNSANQQLEETPIDVNKIIIYEQPEIMPLSIEPFRTNANEFAFSIQVTCPYCCVTEKTHAIIQPGWVTFAAAIFLTPILCCCIPCNVDSCQDVVHYCKTCKKEVGKKTPC